MIIKRDKVQMVNVIVIRPFANYQKIIKQVLTIVMAKNNSIYSHADSSQRCDINEG